MPQRAAKIEQGQVVQVIVGAAAWAQDRLGGVWVDLGGQRAGRGWTWHDDHARPPQPWPSWTWAEDRWEPPVPMPDDGEWWWDEVSGGWVDAPPPPLLDRAKQLHDQVATVEAERDTLARTLDAEPLTREAR